MGLRLLDQLWDDTVAGPQPDSGLGKLRKHKTFSFRSSSATGSSDGGNVRSYGENSTEEAKVTRSIMIIKPPGYGSGNGGSAPVSPAGFTPPASPAGSTPPVSPFSGNHSGGFEEGQHRMHTRRRARSLEQGAPVLLTTCNI
ncbi:dormancy-associated protein homolog 3-like isoform X2 [Pyrus x bretschneideri]|uniref:dormancy-associated protein homolog 3-like isoform X2 n=1 Tax=Pyrus x bretschneideri TaxID=225117 RepID=UPI002030BB5E|nr:dormancy-associated protein homolog 3-like isoform X2 [Pyrus x bretschneideri]